MPKLPHRIRGKTNVNVPILWFRTVPIGNRCTTKNAVSIFHEAINLGIPYIVPLRIVLGMGTREHISDLY